MKIRAVRDSGYQFRISAMSTVSLAYYFTPRREEALSFARCA
jgi:hypothetical protein